MSITKKSYDKLKTEMKSRLYFSLPQGGQKIPILFYKILKTNQYHTSYFSAAYIWVVTPALEFRLH